MHHLLQRNRRRLLRNEVIVLAVFVAAALTACSSPRKQTTATTQATEAAISESDACPQRLHDLEGGLLLYYAQNRRLPPTLASLVLPGTDAAAAAEAILCPVSHQPYVYDPRGLPGPDGVSRLIVYDSLPSHNGRRWAITIAESDGNQPLIAKVIAVPESTFAAPAGR